MSTYTENYFKQAKPAGIVAFYDDTSGNRYRVFDMCDDWKIDQINAHGRSINARWYSVHKVMTVEADIALTLSKHVGYTVPPEMIDFIYE